MSPPTDPPPPSGTSPDAGTPPPPSGPTAVWPECDAEGSGWSPGRIGLVVAAVAVVAVLVVFAVQAAPGSDDERLAMEGP